MARFCVVVIALCCLVTCCCGDVAPRSAVTRKCSVERSGVLTMFNGQTSTVAVPCKYRLAKIQCGEYQLRVTPGSQLDSSNTFSPYRVFVRIQKTGLAGYAWVRTTSRRLQRVAEGTVENPWYVKRGNLISFDLDLAGFDSAKEAAVLRKDGVFEVEFNADQASVVVRCFSDSFSSTSQPDALCGDGEPGDAATKEEILDMVFTNNEVVQRPRPSCPRVASVYQQCPSGVSDADTCNEILLQQATVDCLAASGTSLAGHYHRCLTALCGVDTSALDPMLHYIKNNCALDPGSDCSTATFVGCDSKSTCEGGAICKRELNQPCAGFSDHCVDGTTCDPETNICTAVNTEDSTWLNSTCSADSDCPAARSTCFKGLCLCTPGYYYSVGQKTCVEECAQSDLEETFVKYPGSAIIGYIMSYVNQTSEEDCLESCRQVAECRSFQYDTSRKCYLLNRTVLDISPNDWITAYDKFTHYQAMCK